jgi:hypothetical protein
MTESEGDSSFLGPSYEYWKNIKQPSQMGMSPDFTLDALAADVTGILSYVEILVTGSGNASKTGKPLGNKFFLKTKGKCRELTIDQWRKHQEEDKQWEYDYNKVGTDLKNKKITEEDATKKKNALSELKKKREETREKKFKNIVDRYIYVNNIPDGTIPFISSGADGSSFKDLRGLIPGAIGNLGALNPAPLFKAFVTGSTPDCTKISLETVDAGNTKAMETRHLAIIDLEEMNPCNFSNGSNPVSGYSCQGFTEPKTANKPLSNSLDDEKPNILVSEDGEEIGLYEIGDLAGSSGIAYKTTHRSPLSYNIANNKASTMSGLDYSKFELPKGDRKDTHSSKDILNNHSAVSSSFFKSNIAEHPLDNRRENDNNDNNDEWSYDAMISKLTDSLKPKRSNADTTETVNDFSKINGGIPVQIYYASLSFLILYFIYKMNYRMVK